MWRQWIESKAEVLRWIQTGRGKHEFKRRSNNSKSSFSDTLKKVISSGGTITYFFETERIKFSKKTPQGETYVVKSMLKTSFNPQILLNIKGERRSPEEIRTVLQTTAEDLGAVSFNLE